MMQDAFSRDLAAAQAAGDAQARASRKDVRVFAEMFLALGSDCIKIAGTAHDAELAEAKGLAAARWNQLLELEAQIPREEARLATMERGRVPDPADEFTGPEVLAKKDKAHRERVEGTRSSLKQLKEEAKRGRKELESFITKRR